MPNQYVQVQVSLDSDTLLPADRAVNVWHFKKLVDDAEASDYNTLVDTLWSNIYSGMQSRFHQTLAGTARVACYDLEDSEPRIAVYEEAKTLSPGTGVMPMEVAIALSFEATPQSGQDQRRRRGRIYLGPLSPTSFAHEGGQTSVSSAARTAIVGAYETMFDALLAAQWHHCVFSRADRSEGASYGVAMHEVARAWVDDAPDIQRRRGFRPTTRTMVTVVP